MVGVSFAAVPLYRLFCAATGYGGTPQIGQAAALAGRAGEHLGGMISTAEAKCDAFCAHGRLTTRIEVRNCAEVYDGWSRLQTSSSWV